MVNAVVTHWCPGSSCRPKPVEFRHDENVSPMLPSHRGTRPGGLRHRRAASVPLGPLWVGRLSRRARRQRRWRWRWRWRPLGASKRRRYKRSLHRSWRGHPSRARRWGWVRRSRRAIERRRCIRLRRPRIERGRCPERLRRLPRLWRFLDGRLPRLRRFLDGRLPRLRRFQRLRRRRHLVSEDEARDRRRLFGGWPSVFLLSAHVPMRDRRVELRLGLGAGRGSYPPFTARAPWALRAPSGQGAVRSRARARRRDCPP
jgi:hypothetical protein